MNDPPRDDSAAHLATWSESWGDAPAPVRDRVNVLTDELARAQDAISQLKRTIERTRQDAQSEIDELEGDVAALRARLEMESEARQLADARADKAGDIARRWLALPPGPRDNVLAVLEMYERIEGER